MKKIMARKTIKKILQDPSLKERRKGIVVKVIFIDAISTPRNYMIILLNDKSKLYGGYNLFPEFAINLGGNASCSIGISDSAYIVKPTLKDYLELWEMYRKCKGNGVDNKSNKG